LAPIAVSQTFTYDVQGDSYEGYFVSPKKNSPLILLVHDWDGLTDYEIQRANMLAELGYAVMAADLFGKGVRPTAVKDKKEHTGELYQDRDKMRTLLNGALKAAAKKGAGLDKVVAMGYCFGGAAVLELARSGVDLLGTASFHGGLATPEGQDYSEAKGKVIIFHGAADKMIKMDQVAELANELEAAKVPHEIISYGGAPHAFTVFGSDRYRREADENSWDRFASFLGQVNR
jgi:dienelactone hydrolase